jgi:hypothetical protein
LKKPEVAAALRDARRERAERLELSADDVLLELWLIALTADRTRTRVTALSWIGKFLGLQKTNVRVTEELPPLHFILTDESKEESAPESPRTDDRGRVRGCHRGGAAGLYVRHDQSLAPPDAAL